MELPREDQQRNRAQNDRPCKKPKQLRLPHARPSQREGRTEDEPEEHLREMPFPRARERRNKAFGH